MFNKQHNYYTLDNYLKEQYQQKVFKVALNGSFSCPNRDGAKSTGGCIFCSGGGSGEFAGDKTKSLKEQFTEVRSIISKKWPNSLYIAYFQANTNTYAPIEKLKKLFEEAITLDKDIIALSIATRPDCLADDIINYLAELNKKIPIWVELGLQTIYDSTANLINRCYPTSTFFEAVKRLRANNLTTIVHIINGLPYETKEMMIETAKALNNIDIQGVKIHSLYVLKGTKLEQMYNNNEFKMMSLEEHVEVVAKQLEYLSPDIVIHRISGDAPKDLLVAPLWSVKKLVVMNELDKYMHKHAIYQGDKFLSR